MWKKKLKQKICQMKNFRAEYCDFTKKFGSKNAVLKMANRNAAEITDNESERNFWELTVCCDISLKFCGLLKTRKPDL